MRYALYTMGLLLLFVLVAFISRSVMQISDNLDAADYLTRTVVGLPAPQTSGTYAATEALKAWTTHESAPSALRENDDFNDLKQRHYTLLKTFEGSFDSGTANVQTTELQETLGAMRSDLAQLHAGAVSQAKHLLMRLILFSAVLAAIGLSLIAVPLFLQHRRSLLHINESNRKMGRQALELRAVHITIGNMLEDILLQRKQATRTSEINARLAAVINSADDAIFSLNMAGYITTANLAAAKLFGYHCEGTRFADLFSSDIALQLKSSLMVTEEQNSGSTIDVTIYKKQQRIDLSLTISPIHTEEQRLTGFSVIAKNVSHSKLEEERFRLAVEAAPNAMIMINAHGYVVLFNSEAERMFGYKSAEVYGQPIHLLLPESLQAEHPHYVQSFLEKTNCPHTSSDSHELKGQRKSGARFPIEVGLTPIEINKETYVISSVIDTSERIAQQKFLTDLNQELRRKNEEMEQFIYAVSHDLKAPLVTIAGFAKRLLTANDLDLPPSHQHKLERIIANVQSMEALLRDLLHLSRVIKRDLEKSHVDTQVTLSHVFDSLEGIIRKANAQINVQYPLTVVYAQESLLFQCLQNIISNSIKYAHADRAPIIDIQPVESPAYTGISIQDNGIGIAPRYHERIFNVFERLSPEICEGTGVGLSIVKTIIEKHSGKIELSSAEGEGTRFSLLFPRDSAHQ